MLESTHPLDNHQKEAQLQAEIQMNQLIEVLVLEVLLVELQEVVEQANQALGQGETKLGCLKLH